MVNLSRTYTAPQGAGIKLSRECCSNLIDRNSNDSDGPFVNVYLFGDKEKGVYLHSQGGWVMLQTNENLGKERSALTRMDRIAKFLGLSKPSPLNLSYQTA